jgi:hypothetical protein
MQSIDYLSDMSNSGKSVITAICGPFWRHFNPFGAKICDHVSVVIDWWLIYTATLIIIEGQFHVLQRFSSGKLVLKAVGSRFATLSYYENGSTGIEWCGDDDSKMIVAGICMEDVSRHGSKTYVQELCETFVLYMRNDSVILHLFWRTRTLAGHKYENRNKNSTNVRIIFEDETVLCTKIWRLVTQSWSQSEHSVRVHNGWIKMARGSGSTSVTATETLTVIERE